MRDPGLDFQGRRGWLPGILLLLVAGVLCLDALAEYHGLSLQREELAERERAATRRAERLAAARRAATPDTLFSAAEIKLMQQAAQAMRVDWEGLFAAVERAGSEEVCLLAVRPDVGGKALWLSGEARDLPAVLAFVEALRKAPLANVVLLSHQIRQGDPQHPVSFEIAATWTPAS